MVLKKTVVSHEMTLLHVYVVENSGYLWPVIFQLLLSVTFSQALILSLPLTFKFSKAANCDFKPIVFPNPNGRNLLRRRRRKRRRKSSLTFPSISFYTMNHSTTNFGAHCLCTDTASLTSATTRQ
jgi:hypothetical protein